MYAYVFIARRSPAGLCKPVRGHTYMTSAAQWVGGGGSRKADKKKGVVCILYVTKGGGGPKILRTSYKYRPLRGYVVSLPAGSILRLVDFVLSGQMRNFTMVWLRILNSEKFSFTCTLPRCHSCQTRARLVPDPKPLCVY